MWDEVVALAIWQHGVLTLDDFLVLGVPPRTVQRWAKEGRLVRLEPATYGVVGHMDDDAHVCALLRRYPRAVASHRTAARLHGLDGILDDVVEVTVPRASPVRGRWVHRADDVVVLEVVERDGLRFTDVARTLCDLGAVVDDVALELATEAGLRLGVDYHQLLERATTLSRPGKRGPAALRDLLRRRGAVPASGSAAETLYLRCLRDHGVEEPVRQHEVRDAGGRLIAVLDAAWPPVQRYAEIDGYAFHSSTEAFQHDRSRQNALTLLGWAPLRFTYADVTRFARRTAWITQQALLCDEPSSGGGFSHKNRV
jgi:hypothetical protein